MREMETPVRGGRYIVLQLLYLSLTLPERLAELELLNPFPSLAQRTTRTKSRYSTHKDDRRCHLEQEVLGTTR
jgi:hypothetical protein